jgi:hypothetical protein
MSATRRRVHAHGRWPSRYTRCAQDWPPIAEALLRAAQGAVLVTVSNLYEYGEIDGPMTEDTPLAATGTKGRVRAHMWHQALARHEAGDLAVTEARASDYIGPGIGENGLLDARVVPRLLRGKAVWTIGATDVPHSWTAVEDVAETLAVLGATTVHGDGLGTCRALRQQRSERRSPGCAPPPASTP